MTNLKIFQQTLTLNGQMSAALFAPIKTPNEQIIAYGIRVPAGNTLLEDETFGLAKGIEYVNEFYKLADRLWKIRRVITYFVLTNSQYVRALTSVRDQNGHYAIGTILTNVTVLNTLNNNQVFNGNVTLFNQTYCSRYKRFKNNIVLFAAHVPGF